MNLVHVHNVGGVYGLLVYIIGSQLAWFVCFSSFLHPTTLYIYIYTWLIQETKELLGVEAHVSEFHASFSSLKNYTAGTVRTVT